MTDNVSEFADMNIILPKQHLPTERHVVLVAPQIHWNTGNIGRTCLATGSFLHLIEPLGFSLDSREVQRAGLDYWENVKLTLWNDFDEFLKKMAPNSQEVAVFSKTGIKSFWDLPAVNRLFLVFGSETRGLAASILKRYADSTYHIPISAEIRSLNLSTAVGIALYESLRLAGPFHAWGPGSSAVCRKKTKPEMPEKAPQKFRGSGQTWRDWIECGE